MLFRSEISMVHDVYIEHVDSVSVRARHGQLGVEKCLLVDAIAPTSKGKKSGLSGLSYTVVVSSVRASPDPLICAFCRSAGRGRSKPNHRRNRSQMLNHGEFYRLLPRERKRSGSENRLGGVARNG